MIVTLDIPNAIYSEISQNCLPGMTLEDELRYFIAKKAWDIRHRNAMTVAAFSTQDLSEFSGVPFSI